MSRSRLFHQFSRTMRIAWFAEREKISTGEALERVTAAQWKAQRRRSRREFLGEVVNLAAAGVLASVAAPLGGAQAKPGGGGASSRNIAIVGARMAGLACADRLREAGLRATVYEAAPNRVGGPACGRSLASSQAARLSWAANSSTIGTARCSSSPTALSPAEAMAW